MAVNHKEQKQTNEQKRNSFKIFFLSTWFEERKNHAQIYNLMLYGKFTK